MVEIDIRKCPNCKDTELVLKKGKFGDFFSCKNYPDCKHTEPVVKRVSNLKKINELCVECDSDLVIREKKSNGEKFIACSGFPKCRYIKPEKESLEKLFELNEISFEEKERRINFRNKNKN